LSHLDDITSKAEVGNLTDKFIIQKDVPCCQVSVQ